MYVPPHCGRVKRHRVSIVVLEERLVHPLELSPLRVIPTIDGTIVHHDRSAGRMLNSLSGVTSRTTNCLRNHTDFTRSECRRVVAVFDLQSLGIKEIEQATRTKRVAKLLKGVLGAQLMILSTQVRFLMLRFA